MSGFPPTKEQQDIYDAFDNDPSHILINAIAGSGKTSTLLALAKRLDKRFIMICFNSSIQKEIQSKLDVINEAKGVKLGMAFTMHSLGLVTIKTKTAVKVNNYFYYRIMLDIQNDPNVARDINQLEFSDKAAAGRTLLDLFNTARMFNTFDLVELEEHMESMGKPIIDPWKKAEDDILSDNMEFMYEELVTRAEANYASSKPNIDFIDMLYLPVVWDLDIPYKPTYLFMDECQDFNFNQHNLVDKLLKQPQLVKAVAVGDPKQSIYAFAGALNDSFDRFNNKGTFKQYPLSVNFRSSKEVVKEVNKVYDIMTGFKEEEGKSLSLPYDPEIFDANSMILCRNKAPLVEIFVDLLSIGQSPTIKGMDILKSFRTFVMSNKFKSISKLSYETSQKLYKEKRKKEPSKAIISNLEENLDLLDVFANRYTNCQQIIQQIDKIKNMDGSIILSTIHKSKGLEHPNVYIYDEGLIPSKYAETDVELEQEENLRYVARSRAMTKLVYVHPKKEE